VKFKKKTPDMTRSAYGRNRFLKRSLRHWISCQTPAVTFLDGGYVYMMRQNRQIILNNS
jgi:hypothetical protein